MCGGGAAANKGYFIQPTVFGDVQDNMIIAREEVGRSGRCQSVSLWYFSWVGAHRDLSPLGVGGTCGRGVAGLRSEWISSIFCCRFLVQWCRSWSSSLWRRWWNEPTTPNTVWQQLCSLRTSTRRIIYPTGYVQAPSGTQCSTWFIRNFQICINYREIIHKSVQVVLVKMKLRNRFRVKKLFLVLLSYSDCITLNVR